VAANPDAGVSSASPSSDQHGKCLLIIHGEATPAVDRVSDFVSRLDFDPIRVESAAGDNGAAIESLEQHPNAAFAVIVLDAHTAASARPGAGGTVDSRLVFQLGYCVGKLGLRRICVLIPDSGGAFCDQHGVLFVPLDGADGWQLQVARQLKRSGIEIDLNRMC
jgi:predicted nucleotide-binding protein